MKFISILGYDRSGTTFLGSYLSHLNRTVFYAGEIDKGLEHYLAGSVKRCSCGETYLDCAVWGKILPFLDPKNIDLKFIVEKIKEITGATVIVDSSKSLSYIKKFREIFKEDHLTIHVKRNPNGVILSRMKIRKKRVEKGTHPKPHIANKYNMMMIYDSLEWCYENNWIERFKVKKYNLDLTYDHFEKQLPNKIIDFLKANGISYNREGQITDHIIWGNKGRLNFRKEVQINHNWKNELNIFQRTIVNFITYPIRKIYKYSF